jgi:methylthioribose-1-phosphate isomerase
VSRAAEPGTAQPASPTRGLATLRWEGDLAGGCCRMIDQTLLPGELLEIEVRTQEAMWDAIKRLAVRGAPASAWRPPSAWCSARAAARRATRPPSAPTSPPR